MAAPFEQLAELDRLIHEPARLAILTALSACGSADYVFLQRLTGLTGGNLTSHLARLQDAGLVAIDKQFVGKTPRTHVGLTDAGRAKVTDHWERLERLNAAARSWRPGHEGD